MKTSLFTKVIDENQLFIFEFNGDIPSPYGYGPMMRIGILTKEGFQEKKIDIPAGKYTKIDSLNFHSAMKKSQENVKELTRQWKEKEDARKAAEAKQRAERISEMSEHAKGWYEVIIEYAVNDFHRGGHKWKTLEGRVIANSAYGAYLKGTEEIEKKEGFFVQEPENAIITYIGVITDEYLIENGEL